MCLLKRKKARQKCIKFDSDIKLMEKILFVGDLNEISRSFERYQVLIDLKYSVEGISMVPVPFWPGIDKSSFWEKLMCKLSLPLDLNNANRQIKELIKKNRYDIVWVETGNCIRPSVLRQIKRYLPAAKLVSCSDDNMCARHNRSWYYLWGLPYYDIVFTTKSHNVLCLKSLGARRVVLFLDAYDAKIHRPLKLTEEDKKRFGCEVEFIGTFEEDRAKKMLYLAENGIKIIIWGNGWESWAGKHPNLIIKKMPVYGEDYVKAINAAKINLSFLRKKNNDEVTARSVEIPACGGFMIAERTKRHLDFFEEGKEAVFFDSPEELLFLVKKYLVADKKREEIGQAGRLRCIKSGYNHQTQLQNMLSLVKNP